MRTISDEDLSTLVRKFRNANPYVGLWEARRFIQRSVLHKAIDAAETVSDLRPVLHDLLDMKGEEV